MHVKNKVANSSSVVAMAQVAVSKGLCLQLVSASWPCAHGLWMYVWNDICYCGYNVTDTAGMAAGLGLRVIRSNVVLRIK